MSAKISHRFSVLDNLSDLHIMNFFSVTAKIGSEYFKAAFVVINAGAGIALPGASEGTHVPLKFRATRTQVLPNGHGERYEHDFALLSLQKQLLRALRFECNDGQC